MKLTVYLINAILLSALAAPASASDVGNLLLGNTTEHTPLDLMQSVSNTPGLISVIGSEEIKAYNIAHFVDVLRYVPGFTVRKTDFERYEVSYHDSSALHIQVLINGIAQQGGVRAINHYQLIPIPVEQIERINVYRGPTGAKFGGNSFSAVIDVITKKSINTENLLKASVNTDGSLDSSLALVLSNKAHEFSTYLNFRDDDEFNKRYSSQLIGPNSRTGVPVSNPGGATSLTFMSGYRYTTDNAIANISYNYSKHVNKNKLLAPPPNEPDDQELTKNAVSGTLGFSAGRHNHSFLLDLTNWDNKEEFTYIAQQFQLYDELHALYIQNPAYVISLSQGNVPTGGTESDDLLRDAILFRIATDPNALAVGVGTVDNNYDDDYIRLGYVDNIEINNRVRLEAAFTYQKIESVSPTFFSLDRPKRQSESFSSHLYTEINYDPIIFNVGYYVEKISTYDDDIFFSPLVALNYHVDAQTVVKAMYSSATRPLDLVYTDLNWRYNATNITPALTSGETEGSFFISHTTEGRDLSPERNASYQLVLDKQGEKFRIQVGAFYDEREDIIFTSFNYFNFDIITEDFNTYGVESEIEYRVNESNRFKIVLSSIENDAETDVLSAYIPSNIIATQYSHTGRYGMFAANLGRVEYLFYNDVFADVSYGFNIGRIGVHARALYDNNVEYFLLAQDRASGSIQADVSERENQLIYELGLKYSF